MWSPTATTYSTGAIARSIGCYEFSNMVSARSGLVNSLFLVLFCSTFLTVSAIF
jgi:hypothetical protein